MVNFLEFPYRFATSPGCCASVIYTVVYTESTSYVGLSYLFEGCVGREKISINKYFVYRSTSLDIDPVFSRCLSRQNSGNVEQCSMNQFMP